MAWYRYPDGILVEITNVNFTSNYLDDRNIDSIKLPERAR